MNQTILTISGKILSFETTRDQRYFGIVLCKNGQGPIFKIILEGNEAKDFSGRHASGLIHPGAEIIASGTRFTSASDLFKLFTNDVLLT